jgi:hypothetical protein
MPPPLLQLLPPLVNGKSAAAATVLLPPAPLACFYSGAALAMYQSSMRKRRAGLSTITDELSLDQHNDNIEAQYRRINHPDICHGSNNDRIDNIDTNCWS